MLQPVFHTSENKNSYLYNPSSRLFNLIHPELKKIHEKSLDIDPYYSKKYEYLKGYSFFSPAPVEFTTLNETMVKDSIIHASRISFEVTDYCNLKCTYCSCGELYTKTEIRNQKNASTIHAICLLKYYFEHKEIDKRKKFDIGFYGGEPLINIKFIKEIVGIVNTYTSEQGLNIRFHMTTNATLIHKHIDFLIENNFELLISLDGNEKNHSYRTFSKNNKNSFWKVIENIDMIQQEYPAYFMNYVNFNAVLHDRNSVKEIYEFIYLRYHKIPSISQLANQDLNADKKDVHYELFHSKQKSESEYLKEKSNLLEYNQTSIYKELVYYLKTNTINYYVSNITALLHNKQKQLPTGTCLPGSKRIFLTTNNTLLPCEKINHQFSIGEANSNIEMNIPEITRQYNSYYKQITPICQRCYANNSCSTCLFSLHDLDKLGSENFACDRFYNLIDYKNKLYRTISLLEKHPNEYLQILENVILE